MILLWLSGLPFVVIRYSDWNLFSITWQFSFKFPLKKKKKRKEKTRKERRQQGQESHLHFANEASCKLSSGEQPNVWNA